MKRYLLFDSGCSFCTGLARSIERESKGWLTARSLRDPEMQLLLNQAQSHWRWEPSLLEVNHGIVRVFTGLQMRFRLAFGLGPKTAWRVTRLVSQIDEGPTSFGQERRRVLQRFAIGAGIAILGPQMMTKAVSAQTSERPQIVWLFGDEETTLIQEATNSKDVQILLDWLSTTHGWKPKSTHAYTLNVENSLLRNVMFSDGPSSSLLSPQVVYIAGYQKVIARLKGKQYFFVQDGKIQQITEDMLPSNLPVKVLDQHSVDISSSPQPEGRCCSDYLACFAADAVCAALFAACLVGCLPCCPVGLGSCGVGVVECTRAAACGPFDCFS